MTVVSFEVSDDGNRINIITLSNAMFDGINVLVIDFVDDDVAKELLGVIVDVVDASASCMVAMGLRDYCCCCGIVRNDWCRAGINRWDKSCLVDCCNVFWLSENECNVAEVGCWVWY